MIFMKNKTTVALLFVIAVLLALNLIAQLMPGGASPVFNEAQAVSPGSSGTIYVLDQRSFIITSDDTGKNVYVYWFDRDPKREQSTISFITKASAK
jgi:hypothetical protein